jgi:hypothetical protein
MSRAAVRVWSALPRAAREPFIRWTRHITRHSTTEATTRAPGPDTVTGVGPLRAEGFEPIEEHTGAVEVAELWPESHRRWVPETRATWDDTAQDRRLWLVRSPWPRLTVPESLNVVWSWVERDHAPLDADEWRLRVGEVLGWDADTAEQWHRRRAR